MEIIFEFILELVLEGSIEITKNKKVSAWIRYPLIFLIVVFFLAVISLFFLVSFLTYNENKLVALFFSFLGIIFLVLSIKKFKEVYLKRYNKGESNK